MTRIFSIVASLLYISYNMHPLDVSDIIDRHIGIRILAPPRAERKVQTAECEGTARKRCTVKSGALISKGVKDDPPRAVRESQRRSWSCSLTAMDNEWNETIPPAATGDRSVIWHIPKDRSIRALEKWGCKNRIWLMRFQCAQKISSFPQILINYKAILNQRLVRRWGI